MGAQHWQPVASAAQEAALDLGKQRLADVRCIPENLFLFFSFFTEILGRHAAAVFPPTSSLTSCGIKEKYFYFNMFQMVGDCRNGVNRGKAVFVTHCLPLGASAGLLWLSGVSLPAAARAWL